MSIPNSLSSAKEGFGVLLSPFKKAMGWDYLKKKINTGNEAREEARQIGFFLFILAAIQFVVGSMLIGAAVIPDCLIIVTLGFFLYRFVSRIAAVVLCMYSIAVILVTASNFVTVYIARGNASGGANILLALLIFGASIGAIRVSFAFHKLRKVHGT